MIADDFVRQYHNLEVPEFSPYNGPTRLYGGLRTPTPVREYSNALYTCYHGLTYAQRLDFKDALLSFFKKMSKDPESGVLRVDGCYRLTCSIDPVPGIPASDFQKAFGGKAGPTLMRQFIQFINYWRCHLVKLEGKTVTDLQTIVAQYMGTDCNGFVGNYIASKYPALGVDPNNPEETYWNNSKKAGGVRRNNIADVAADDILIFSGHIAIISSVLLRAGNAAIVRVSESRSRRILHGGPQTNTLTLTYSSGSFDLSARDPLIGICRLPGM